MVDRGTNMPLKNIRRLSLLKCETNNEKIVGRDALIAPQRNGKQLTQTRKSFVGGDDDEHRLVAVCPMRDH